MGNRYWKLYEVTARAVKDADPAIVVGGPASAASGWIDAQLRVDAPVDFLSTHVYGTAPMDLRPLAGGRPLLWTEWGITATHGPRINDTVFAATPRALGGLTTPHRETDSSSRRLLPHPRLRAGRPEWRSR